jgi:hypothetical protein
MVRWHYSQPDYILAREGHIQYFWKVAFRLPLVHDTDHQTIVATFCARKTRRLTKYRRRRQRLPLRLQPEPHDKLTRTFKALKLTCQEAEPTKWQGNKWIFAERWRLVSPRTTLRKTGKLCQIGARRMQRQIWAALRGDREARTLRVGNLIEAKLAGGDVQEAFRHLKGWYRAASETTTRPCPQTMARQTAKRVDLYARRDPPGEPLPTNIIPIQLNDPAPSDGEIREAAGGLTNGRAAGASGMRAVDVKAWLHGIKLEEDPEVGPNNIGAGDNWRKFVLLVQAIWDHGEICCS